MQLADRYRVIDKNQLQCNTRAEKDGGSECHATCARAGHRNRARTVHLADWNKVAYKDQL